MKILVTGGTGYIGSALLQRLGATSKELYALFRSRPPHQKGLERVSWFEYDLTSPVNYSIETIDNLYAVVHLAARAHVLDETEINMREFHKVNVEGTLHIARQAIKCGAKRFIFISSIGVNGNKSLQPFTGSETPNPMEPYAISKLKAEEGLHQLMEQTDMELVIIRPPLVYGKNAPGNFARLIQIIHNGLPLPLGLVRNKRSLVAIDNLVDLILTCIDHPAATGQTFMVSDGEDISTPELIQKLARAMGRPARLFPIPPMLLRLGGRMVGKSAEVDRLIGSLQVDISHTCETLGWRPPVSLDAALGETARFFLSMNCKT